MANFCNASTTQAGGGREGGCCLGFIHNMAGNKFCRSVVQCVCPLSCTNLRPLMQHRTENIRSITTTTTTTTTTRAIEGQISTCGKNTIRASATTAPHTRLSVEDLMITDSEGNNPSRPPLPDMDSRYRERKSWGCKKFKWR